MSEIDRRVTKNVMGTFDELNEEGDGVFSMNFDVDGGLGTFSIGFDTEEGSAVMVSANIRVIVDGTRKGFGSDVFLTMFDFVELNYNIPIIQFNALWIKGNMGTNLEKFNQVYQQYLTQDLTEEQAISKAVWDTHTGTWLKNKGFNKANINASKDKNDASGNFKQVTVTFSK